ncbi:MAG: PEP-CTERM sorting domain-containing protein [Okeania sp. SIO3B5]|uniref:PEP-CTERM sorting domain-containing protein n=1 Tax=Okeania sp. SIO3B5 TaxID=2607811 RepID=UPI0013FF8CA7|nr:PEP-CTERM sorting domain-containing protein [Okeania sp. SIO3B5]NEO56700.1 PEP-CTERM sorting domain-containing protein [Okeania sp. SIO3B5]
MKTTKLLTSVFALGSIALGTLSQAKEAAAANIVNTWQASEAVSDEYHSANHNHAFWIPNFSSDFDFEGDAFFNEYDDGTINLIGNIGAGNKKFAVDVWFNSLGNLQEGRAIAPDLAPKKQLNRNDPYSIVDVNDWSYYTIDSSKSLLTEIGEWYGNNNSTDTFFLTDMSETHKGQIGLGANGKNVNKGFSHWFHMINTDDRETYEEYGLNGEGENRVRHYYGDVNIDLVGQEERSGILSESESIPEPATMSLLSLGLLGSGLGALKRKNK